MDAAAALRDELFEKLRSSSWRAGQRLPTERSLSAKFGISRSTVRRVLGDFKRLRLITQTVGSGTYVSNQVRQGLLALEPGAVAPALSPSELMSARLALEPALMDLVVGNATAADFERMDLCNEHAEAAATLAEFEQWDAALHEAVADAAHNSLIASVFRQLSAARTQGEWGVLKRRSATPERRLAYQQEHRDWVAALKQRDAQAARALCLSHLLRVRTNLLGY